MTERVNPSEQTNLDTTTPVLLKDVDTVEWFRNTDIYSDLLPYQQEIFNAMSVPHNTAIFPSRSHGKTALANAFLKECDKRKEKMIEAINRSMITGVRIIRRDEIEDIDHIPREVNNDLIDAMSSSINSRISNMTTASISAADPLTYEQRLKRTSLALKEQRLKNSGKRRSNGKPY